MSSFGKVLAMISKKLKYAELCTKKEIPLFSQYHWMNAVCGENNWDVIIIEENGNTLGTLVYFLCEISDGYEIKKAPLTQNNGIIYFYPKGLKYDRMLAFEYKVADKIIDELEKLGIKKYRQYYHRSFTNWLPFYWRGYSQSTRYTYLIEDTSNLDEVYKNFNSSLRNDLRKAQGIVKIKKGMDCKDFYELNEKTYSRQGIDIPYNFELFNRVHSNLVENKCVEIYYAVDECDNIHSAALFAYDSDSVYYLMSGSLDEFRYSQSLSLLIYEGINLANRLRKSFDFEGSMKKNIEPLFRKFGAKQMQYFDISKEFRL